MYIYAYTYIYTHLVYNLYACFIISHFVIPLSDFGIHLSSSTMLFKFLYYIICIFFLFCKQGKYNDTELWIGQKVHLGFSTGSYGKIQMNFWLTWNLKSWLFSPISHFISFCFPCSVPSPLNFIQFSSVPCYPLTLVLLYSNFFHIWEVVYSFEDAKELCKLSGFNICSLLFIS